MWRYRISRVVLRSDVLCQIIKVLLAVPVTLLQFTPTTVLDHVHFYSGSVDYNEIRRRVLSVLAAAATTRISLSVVTPLMRERPLTESGAFRDSHSPKRLSGKATFRETSVNLATPTKRFILSLKPSFMSTVTIQKRTDVKYYGSYRWAYLQVEYWLNAYLSSHPSSMIVCVDKRGRWVFRSSQPQCERGQNSYDFKCRRWVVEQKKRYDNGRFFTRRLPACPCFLWQAAWDPRYYLDRTINCAILAFPVSSSTIAQVGLRLAKQTPSFCIGYKTIISISNNSSATKLFGLITANLK